LKEEQGMTKEEIKVRIKYFAGHVTSAAKVNVPDYLVMR